VLVLLFQVVKAGYASSLKEAKEMTATEITQAMHYEKFLSDYEKKWYELNHPDRG
jgi:hypothetical protein